MVGSLLLGLHDAAGDIHHVGVASGFSRERRLELAAELAPLRLPADAAHPWILAGDEDGEPSRYPGAQSRWSRGRSLDWVPLAPDRVVRGGLRPPAGGPRFRHATQFLRWRPDRTPADCRYDQLEETPAHELAELLGPGSRRERGDATRRQRCAGRAPSGGGTGRPSATRRSCTAAGAIGLVVALAVSAIGGGHATLPRRAPRGRGGRAPSPRARVPAPTELPPSRPRRSRPVGRPALAPPDGPGAPRRPGPLPPPALPAGHVPGGRARRRRSTTPLAVRDARRPGGDRLAGRPVVERSGGRRERERKTGPSPTRRRSRSGA